MKNNRLCAAIAATAISFVLAYPVSAANSAESDALLTTPVTPQILAQGAEADAYAQGVQAYVWGYPLVGWSGWRGNIPTCPQTTRRPAIARR